MTRCEFIDVCYNKATVMVKARSIGMGGAPSKHVLKKKICEQCNNVINPEHKRRIIVEGNEQDQYHYETLGLDRKYSAGVIIHFRKII